MFRGLGRLLLLLGLGLLAGFLPFDFLSSQLRARCQPLEKGVGESRFVLAQVRVTNN